MKPRGLNIRRYSFVSMLQVKSNEAIHLRHNLLGRSIVI